MLVLLAGCGGASPTPDGSSEHGRVAFVADGDTLRLLDGRRVRLVQIDAPEAGAECYGVAATRALRVLARSGVSVQLERDPALDGRDRFGRLLRHVFVGETNLNLVLVQRGVAAPYFYRGERGRYADELDEAAQDARGARRGLWGACPRARLAPQRALDAGPP